MTNTNQRNTRALRATITSLIAGAFAASSAMAADAPHKGNDYPAKPIRIISPLVPGGSADAIARAVGDILSEGLGQQVVTGLFTNKPMHLLGQASVGRVPLRPRTQFNEMHGLSGVHLHYVVEPIGQGNGVRRLIREGLKEGLVEITRAIHGLCIFPCLACFFHNGRKVVAQGWI